MAKGVDVDCMREDCKFNKEAKCAAGRILVGDGLECRTYEVDADPLAAVGGDPALMGLGPAMPGVGPAPMAPAAEPAPTGPPRRGLEDLLAGGLQ